MSWLELVDSNAATFPSRTAVYSAEGSLTYAELREMSNGLSDRLLCRLSSKLDGSRPPIAVVGHKSPKMLVGFLGAMKSGSPYIPLDDEVSPRRRVQRIIEEARAWRVQASDLEGTCDDTQPELSDDKRPAYIIFTSGSTGVPKGVSIPVEAVEHFVTSLDAIHKFEPGETWLNVAPWSFDLSVLELYVGLAMAGSIVSVTRSDIDDPNKLFELLSLTDVHNWVSTPSFADYCLAETQFDDVMLPTLKRFFFCGEVLKEKTARRLLRRFPNAHVYNMYGPTEACCAVTSVEITDMMEEPLPCGTPLGKMIVDIYDEGGRPVPPGEKGEVVIIGPQVALGYVNVQSDKFFTTRLGERGYRTGDLGHSDEDGQLYIDGRMDRQVKVHGYRIELGEVETALRTCKNVEDVVAARTRTGLLRAYVIGHVDISELKAELRLKVATYMVPHSIVVRDSFPRNENGKIDVQALEGEAHADARS